MKSTLKLPTPARRRGNGKLEDLPVIAIDLPVMFEDEGQEEMGDTDVHSQSVGILRYGLEAHLAPEPQYRVFSDLNCHYHPIKRRAYFSADIMIVAPPKPLPAQIRSYRIGPARPAPLVTVEVLSRRSFQQEDLTRKPEIYADVGVREYILVDVTGEFLPERLLLKRRQPGGSWKDEQDPDGGVTSQLAFRILVERDGQVRVLKATTSQHYPRPSEAGVLAERVRALEAELKRMRTAEKKNGKRVSRKDRPK